LVSLNNPIDATWLRESVNFDIPSFAGFDTLGQDRAGNTSATVADPLVSAIIPFHIYRRNTIIQAIYSVTNQTYSNVEVVVVDGSGDARAKELNQISFSKPVKIVHAAGEKARTNAGYNRNRGIEASSGEYVAFLDADDAWFPTKLQDQLHHSILYGVKFFSSDASAAMTCRDMNGVFTPWNLSDPSNFPTEWNGNLFKEALGKKAKSPIRDGAFLPALLDLPLLRWHNVAITSTVVVQKSLIEKAGYFTEDDALNGKKIEDWVTWWKILETHPNERMGYYSKSTTVYDYACHGKDGGA
jgi:glycosyltransferase involved in cell wall biosynthesis